jgi:hypothetical protein
VRYLVKKLDGQYVAMLTIAGCSPPTTYATATRDAKDAHDFGSRPAAESWIRANGHGKVAELTDDGYWPLED